MFLGERAGSSLSVSNTCSYTLRHPFLAEKARGFIMYTTSVRNIIGGAIALCVSAGMALGAPSVALARSPLASGATEVRLGFGATYAAADGKSSTHRGLDLVGEEGAEVVAPLAGEVTFVGRVPGAGGTTVLATSIRTAQGSVTLLPLDRVMVVRGATVEEGEQVATLAADGDVSSSATHLHLGLRMGNLYLDPTSLMPVPIAAQPAAEAQPVTVGEPAVGTVGAAVGAAVGDAVLAPGVTVGVADAVSTPTGAVSTLADVVSATGSPGTVPGVSVVPVTTSAGSRLADAGSNSAAVAGEVAPGVTLSGSSGRVPEALQATGVLADAGETISTGAKVARAASSAARDGRLGSAISRGMRMAGRGARTAALLAAGVLCAVGALWPLWRAGGMEGLGKVPVSAIRDDVAAVASR